MTKWLKKTKHFGTMPGQILGMLSFLLVTLFGLNKDPEIKMAELVKRKWSYLNLYEINVMKK